MARKIVTYEVEKGRDSGKRFIITELSARQTSILMMRIGKILSEGYLGINKLKDNTDFSFENILSMVSTKNKSVYEIIFELISGSLAYSNIEEINNLFDELLHECVKYQVDKNNSNITTPLIVDSIIEDFTTIFSLQKEILKLHFGFFLEEQMQE